MDELDYYLVILFEDGVLDVEANKGFVDVLRKMIQLKHIPSPGDTIDIRGWDGFEVKWVGFNYWTYKPVIEINTDFPNFSNLEGTSGGYTKVDDEGEPGEFLIFQAGYVDKYNSLLKRIFKD